MHMPDKPDPSIREVLVVDDPEAMKLLLSGRYNEIMDLIDSREMAVSDIAKTLKINPGSVHYHLKELEKHGLVKQVRDEVKGGVVKKYYRAAARRILMETPDFNRPDKALPAEELTEHLLRSVEYLGYQVMPENVEDAKDLLFRYDRRIKALIVELESTGLKSVEENALTVQSAYGLILGIQSRTDPELGRIFSEFDKLFLRYE